MSSLIPMQIVASGFFAGALMSTRLAPAGSETVDAVIWHNNKIFAGSAIFRECRNRVSAESRMRKRTRQWRIGALTAVLFSCFCGQVDCAPATDASQMKTIFVFGDSLSEGLAISPRQAWPMLLVEKLRPIGPNFRVINASAS